MQIITKNVRFRRAGKGVTVAHDFTVDPNRLDPETGQMGFTYATPDQMVAHTKRVKAAWLEKYEEELPPRRVGRKPVAERREHLVPVRMSPSELKALDLARGERSRAAHIRMILAFAVIAGAEVKAR